MTRRVFFTSGFRAPEVLKLAQRVDERESTAAVRSDQMLGRRVQPD